MVENDAAANIPTLDEFLATVGPLNPDASNKDLIDAYQTHFGVTVPAPETRSTLPSLEEFTNTLRPLNPGATDDDLRQAWQDKFGVLGAREKKPSFTESVGSGFEQGLLGLKEQAAGFRDRSNAPGGPDKQFAKEAGDQLAEAAQQYNVPADLEEQSVWKKFTDPEYLGHVIGQQLSGNIPSIGGAIVGGLAGGAVAGPPGALAGATAGMGGATFLQRAGEAYREAFQKNKDAGLSDEDAHDKAYTQSGIAGTVSGVINSLAVPLTLVRPFTGVLKNLLLQYAGNVAIDTADQASGNVVMGHAIGEGIPEAAMTSALFGAPETMAGVKAALHSSRLKDAPPPQTPPPQQSIQPTPPPSSAPSSPSEIRKDPLEVAKPITDPSVKTVDDAIDRAKKVTDEVPIDTDALDKAVGNTVSEDVKKIKDDVEKVARDAELKALDDKRKADLQNDQLTLDTLKKYSGQMGAGKPLVVDPETLPDEAPSSNPSAMTKSAYIALSNILGLDGTRLRVYQGTNRNNGFISPALDQPTVWVNANTKVDPSFVAFHEVQHIMQKSEIFDAFRDVVLRELKPNAYQAAELRHSGLSKERLLNEMMSDIHGDAMTQESFHKKLIARLESQAGPEAAQTKLTQFLDTLKGMIARVREHLTEKLYTNAQGGRIVENYVNNLEKVHDALAGALAEHYRVKGLSAELPIPEAGKDTFNRGGQARIVVHPEAVNAFTQVAKQRHAAARPSSLQLLKHKGAESGASAHLSNLLHHLTAASHEGHANRAPLQETIGKTLRALRGTNYGAINERDLKTFRDTHAALPVYNQPQWLAREAAIAYGEKRVQDAQRLVKELEALTQKDDFNRQALSFKRGGDGKLAQHLNEVEGEMIIEKGAKEPKFRLPDGREVTQSEMLKTRQRVKPTKLSTRDEKPVAKPTPKVDNAKDTQSTVQPKEGVKTREEDEKGQGRKEGLLTKKPEPAEKSAPSPTYKHFTSKESAKSLRSGSPFDSTRTPVHGTKDFADGPAVHKFAGNRLYLSLDDTRWGTQTKTDSSIKAEPLGRDEKPGPNDEAFFDYDTQQWMVRKNAVTNESLEGVDYRLRPDAKILRINNPTALKSVEAWAGGFNLEPFWDNIKKRYDAVEITNTTRYGEGDERLQKFFRQAGGDQIVVLNPDAAERVETNGSKSLEDRLPPDLQVDIRALRESTGEMVMTKEDAKTALKDLDESLAKYQQLLKCVQS